MRIALLTKIGIAPFHFWFPEIIEGLNWLNSFILLTWQKIAPLILISYNFFNRIFFSIIILIGILIRGIIIWNQSRIKKILAFSSINHLRWILRILFFNQSILLFYFCFYSILTLILVIIFKTFKILKIKELIIILNSNKNLKLLIFLTFFSLGGVPPFLGFFFKWIIIKNLIINNFNVLAFFIVIFTLITLYAYIRLILNSMLIKTQELIFIKTFNEFTSYLINFLIFINLGGLILFTILYNFL